MLKVNGKAYDWGDVNLSLPGIVTEVQEISYDDELEKEAVYGEGSKPRGYGTGNYKSSGKLTFLKDDFEEVTNYCKTNNIPLYKLILPKVIVSYAKGDGQITTDVLNKVSFTKITNKAAQGDKNFKVEVELLIAGTIVRDGVEPI